MKGNGKVTSLRIPREFEHLIKKYDLSVSEIFRRGMIVYMYDLGLAFDNSTNKTRSIFLRLVEKELIEFHENKIKELKGGITNNELSNKKVKSE